MSTPIPGEVNRSGSKPSVVKVTDLLEWYRQQALMLQNSQESFKAFSQIPGAERDPEINELAGRIIGVQETLAAFSDMVIKKAGVEADIHPQS